jgi:hypothetical protein
MATPGTGCRTGTSVSSGSCKSSQRSCGWFSGRSLIGMVHLQKFKNPQQCRSYTPCQSINLIPLLYVRCTVLSCEPGQDALLVHLPDIQPPFASCKTQFWKVCVTCQTQQVNFFAVWQHRIVQGLPHPPNTLLPGDDLSRWATDDDCHSHVMCPDRHSREIDTETSMVAHKNLFQPPRAD